MSEILLIGAGTCIGAALTLIWALDKINSAKNALDVVRANLWKASQRLAESHQHVERLTEQVSNLLNDPADAWRNPR
jgi:hypothetical protein